MASNEEELLFGEALQQLKTGVTGYLLCEKHPIEGRMKISEKRVSIDEMMKKTQEYKNFSLKDIFPEEEPKEFMDEIKNIIQKWRM